MIKLPTAVHIAEIQQENYRTKTFVLDARVDAYPGQFVMVWLPRFDEKPFSLVHNDPVTIMVTAVGPFSRLLHEQKVGDRVWLRGPFGQGFQRSAQERRIALVGGGYGVAPLLWLAHVHCENVESIDVIVGARTGDDVLYTGYFQQLVTAATLPESHQAPRITHQITTEDNSLGRHGRVTDVLKPLLAKSRIDAVYACGPHGMLTALQNLGAAYGVPMQLSWEAYMRCAIGICGACEHDGKVLCLDGPVVRSGA